MDENWLEISNKNIDVEKIKRQIQARLTRRREASPDIVTEDPVATARKLWQAMIESPASTVSFSGPISIQERDCDIVPRQYMIDWRIPILGPLNAMIRRLINAEVRRYLLFSLEKQSHFNRQILQLLADLAEENERLRQEVEHLREIRE